MLLAVCIGVVVVGAAYCLGCAFDRGLLTRDMFAMLFGGSVSDPIIAPQCRQHELTLVESANSEFGIKNSSHVFLVAGSNYVAVNKKFARQLVATGAYRVERAGGLAFLVEKK